MLNYTYKFEFKDGNTKEIITGDVDIKRVIEEIEERKKKKISKLSIEDSSKIFNFIKENDVLYLISKDNLKFKI